MARVQQVIDDLTGEALTEEVEPTTITMDGKDYTLDLGTASKDRLLKWLNLEGSLMMPSKTTAKKSTSSAASDSETAFASLSDDDKKSVRHWAIDTKFKFTTKAGKETTMGDRGRVPDVVVQAWQDAGSPGVGA